jgi:hypothetical protein
MRRRAVLSHSPFYWRPPGGAFQKLREDSLPSRCGCRHGYPVWDRVQVGVVCRLSCGASAAVARRRSQRRRPPGCVNYALPSGSHSPPACGNAQPQAQAGDRLQQWASLSIGREPAFPNPPSPLPAPFFSTKSWTRISPRNKPFRGRCKGRRLRISYKNQTGGAFLRAFVITTEES